MMNALFVALVAAAGVPATEPPQPYGSPPRARTELTLSYLADAGFATAVKITCAPPGGTHPEVAEACATLERVGADPSRITPDGGACILVWSPVTAEITGTWRGTPVAWSRRFGNSCEMRRATGALFRF